MNQLMNNRSLKEKVSKINWPELVFNAEAEREWFEDVTIVTLKSEYVEYVYDLAWKQANGVNDVDDAAQKIINSSEVYVNEYIQIGKDCVVKVCIDRDEITDVVVEEVLDMLIDIGIQPDTYHKFGVLKTFTFDEITPTMQQVDI